MSNQTVTGDEASEAFTPGPWRAVCRGLQWWITYGDSDFRVVCQTSQGNDEANARLIAAAPELLEALKAAQKRLELIDGNDEPAVAVRLMIGAALEKTVRS